MINYSFIIPHHNSPDLLNRCLDSIPEREDIQIIVVDDNSKDDLKPQVNRDDIEIIYIDEKNSKGAGHARNIGISYSKGKWLLFADCDDYYENDFISTLDCYKDSDSDAVYYNFNIVDLTKSTIKSDNALQKLLSNDIEDEDSLLYIKFRNSQPWDKMVKRSLVQKNNLYFEEVVNGNDILFSLFIAVNSKIIKVERKKLYNYIKNTDSLSNRRQTISDIQCRVDHIIKHNAFNSYIGHSEWNFSLSKYLTRSLIHNIKIITIVPKTIWKIFFCRVFCENWIQIIYKHQRC